MISVTSLKDVFVCGDGVGARDEIENIGIEMIRQHLTCSDGKVGLYSEYASGDKESSAEACPGMMSAVLLASDRLTGYPATVVVQ